MKRRIALHLTDARHFKKAWRSLGGVILEVRGTGEVRYLHSQFIDSVRANDRRKDIPAVLISRLNQIRRAEAANDLCFDHG